ncbi:Alpha/Beta hydrolase protein [Panaeolus papilionaceus]|nr:Alpha/Beta hydrolase protein [Panaeolus papilionaceus]
MKPNAYPQPPPFSWDPVEIRKCLPVYPPPEPLDYPGLPSPPRKPSFSAPFTLSTHVFPASYLRTTRQAPVPELPHHTLAKEQKRQRLIEIRKELDALRTSKVTDGYPSVLWNVVNRYLRKGLNESNKTGVTLFLAHANGFPKEIWEPFLGHILSSKAGASIDEVWAWESVQHGDAALINSTSLSGIFDWQDNARDIVNFFTHFLPTRSTATLSVHLPRLSLEETNQRLERGFSERQLIAIGHSYGGCTSALAALMHPILFKSLMLIDPVIIAPGIRRPVAGHNDLALGALSRRDQWSSPEEAIEVFSKNPFFSAWDPAVLQLYISYGTYPSTDDKSRPNIRLKMPPVQEAVVFAEVHTEHEVYDQLRNLDPRIPMRWIMPGKPGAPELGGPGTAEKRVWLRPANSTNTRIIGGGHLIPQEAPLELAEDVQSYLTYLFATNYGEITLTRANL